MAHRFHFNVVSCAYILPHRLQCMIGSNFLASDCFEESFESILSLKHIHHKWPAVCSAVYSHLRTPNDGSSTKLCSHHWENMPPTSASEKDEAGKL